MKPDVYLTLIGARGGTRRERVVFGRNFRPRFYSPGRGHDIHVGPDAVVYNESDADIVANHTRPVRSPTGTLGNLARDIQVTVPLTRRGAIVELTPQFQGRFTYANRRFVRARVTVE